MTHQALLHYAETELGPCSLVADRSWDHGEAVVLELLDSAGEHWIAKQCSSYEREVAALRSWAPAVGAGLAPTLRAADDAAQMFLMDRLPGRAGVADTPDAFSQAGSLIRLLHGAAPAASVPDYDAVLTAQLDRWILRVPGVAEPADIDYARSKAAEVASLPQIFAVPSHCDNQPRNWVVDELGVVRLIDFGHSSVRPWQRDVERMYFAEWLRNPELGAAYMAGYGRELAASDIEFIRCCGAVGAVVTILWAREHGDREFEDHGRRILAMLRSGVR